MLFEKRETTQRFVTVEPSIRQLRNKTVRNGVRT